MRKQNICVFQKNEGGFYSIEQDSFSSTKEALKWITENGESDTVYHVGSFNPKEYRIQTETVKKLV